LPPPGCRPRGSSPARSRQVDLAQGWRCSSRVVVRDAFSWAIVLVTIGSPVSLGLAGAARANAGRVRARQPATSTGFDRRQGDESGRGCQSIHRLAGEPAWAMSRARRPPSAPATSDPIPRQMASSSGIARPSSGTETAGLHRSASRTESRSRSGSPAPGTSFQERMPRGRQPRIALGVSHGGEGSAEARDEIEGRWRPRFPVRSSGAGIASTTSCGSRISESGATASSAATSPSPSAPPNARDSTVSGPPTSGQSAGKPQHYVRSGVAGDDVDSPAKAAARTTAHPPEDGGSGRVASHVNRTLKRSQGKPGRGKTGLSLARARRHCGERPHEPDTGRRQAGA